MSPGVKTSLYSASLQCYIGFGLGILEDWRLYWQQLSEAICNVGTDSLLKNVDFLRTESWSRSDTNLILYHSFLSFMKNELEEEELARKLKMCPNIEEFREMYPREAATVIDWKCTTITSFSYDYKQWLNTDVINYSRLSECAIRILRDSDLGSIVREFTVENIRKMLAPKEKKKEGQGKTGGEKGKGKGEGKKRGARGKGRARGKG